MVSRSKKKIAEGHNSKKGQISREKKPLSTVTDHISPEIITGIL